MKRPIYRIGAFSLGSILIVYAGLYLLTWLTGAIDYSLVAADKSPIIAKVESASLDGGSETIDGFGYVIVTHRKLFVRDDRTLLQEYGAGIRYKWREFFPSIRSVRSDLDFRIKRIVSDSNK
jgi:hypothetical protein